VSHWSRVRREDDIVGMGSPELKIHAIPNRDSAGAGQTDELVFRFRIALCNDKVQASDQLFLSGLGLNRLRGTTGVDVIGQAATKFHELEAYDINCGI
jgi:hypothetical protein